MTSLPNAPATERNREPILEVLRREFAGCRRVLELGSGTGQHAVFFGENLPELQWQCSDVTENHADIRQWLESAALPNVQAPVPLNVLHDPDPDGEFDAVFSANTAHIMKVEAVQCMFALAGRILGDGQPFCLYGPFRLDGDFTSESNASFDASLKSRNPEMGIRDLEMLDDLASKAGLQRQSLIAMPANNFIAVWRKMATAAS